MGVKTFVVGCGMSRFEKPGRRDDADYTDDALQAMTKAFLDANLTYDAVDFAAVGYCYGDSTCGQRAVYQLGLGQIPIVNVNNNCSTGSTALYLARQAVLAGTANCAMALGFEKMNPGSLGSGFQDRTNPLDKTMEIMNELRGIVDAPFAPQIFGNAAIEYLEKNGGSLDALHAIAEKSHNHSTLNPYAQFRQAYSLEQVKKARTVFAPAQMTLLHCSPTSDGAGCVLVANEEFVKKHHLQGQAIEICAQVMATDSTLAFDPEGKNKSCLEVAGADMTRRAAREVYQQAGVTPKDIDVVELHDCFSGNELVTYDSLGLCPPGKASSFTLSGATTLPQFSKGKTPARRVVVNPSGGLISKGHPLGATGMLIVRLTAAGLAQCCELTWQLRGWAGPRQLPAVKYALQHNIGLGGAVVVGIYKRADMAADSQWTDSRTRFGYNPAVECRFVTPEQVERVISAKGGLIGKRGHLDADLVEKLARWSQSETASGPKPAKLVVCDASGIVPPTQLPSLAPLTFKTTLYSDSQYNYSMFWNVTGNTFHGALVFNGAAAAPPLDNSFLAIGFGYGMVDTSAQFIVCHNTLNAGYVTFHQHYSQGTYSPPVYDDNVSRWALQPVAGSVQGQAHICVFKRLLNPNDGYHTVWYANQPMNMVWSFHPRPGVNYLGKRFTYHEQYRGAVSILLASGAVIPAKTANYNAKLWHGFGMMAVWLLFLPFGAFYARYFRSVAGWIIVKATVQVTSFLLMVALLIVVITSGAVFGKVHSYLGAVLLALVAIQVGFGFGNLFGLSSLTFKSKTVVRRIHQFTGYSLLLAAIAQIALGINILFPWVEPRHPEVWAIFIAIPCFWIAAFFTAEVYFFTTVKHKDVGYSKVPHSPPHERLMESVDVVQKYTWESLDEAVNAG
ncbi:sterol carrier protein 2 [Kappamyces sp. JEL0829]|nr:sterol carrier protein 2 [Kappamyces sp. JEL0829]